MGRGQLEQGDVVYLSPIIIKKQLNQYVNTWWQLMDCLLVLQSYSLVWSQLLNCCFISIYTIFCYYYLNVIPNFFKKNNQLNMS